MPQVRRAWVKPQTDLEICQWERGLRSTGIWQGNVKLIATQWHAIFYHLCVHSAGQCSTSQSIKHRLWVRTRKVALEYTAFIGKRVVENARQTLQFYSGVCDVYIYQITPFLPCGLCSSYRAALNSILRNENKRHLDLFSLAFRKCLGCTRIYCWIYFRLQPCKWKNTAANSSQKGHLLFGHGRSEMNPKVALQAPWIVKGDAPKHQYWIAKEI